MFLILIGAGLGCRQGLLEGLPCWVGVFGVWGWFVSLLRSSLVWFAGFPLWFGRLRIPKRRLNG
jgi:hypothetical protein